MTSTHLIIGGTKSERELLVTILHYGEHDSNVVTWGTAMKWQTFESIKDHLFVTATPECPVETVMRMVELSYNFRLRLLQAPQVYIGVDKAVSLSPETVVTEIYQLEEYRHLLTEMPKRSFKLRVLYDGWGEHAKAYFKAMAHEEGLFAIDNLVWSNRYVGRDCPHERPLALCIHLHTSLDANHVRRIVLCLSQYAPPWLKDKTIALVVLVSRDEPPDDILELFDSCKRIKGGKGKGKDYDLPPLARTIQEVVEPSASDVFRVPVQKEKK